VGWERAKEVLKEHQDFAREHDTEDNVSGFYFANSHDHVASVTPVVLILMQRAQHTTSLHNRSFHIIRPNTGNNSKVSNRDHVKKLFTKADPMEPKTQTCWNKLYTFYEKNCGHKNCSHMSLCSYKSRIKEHNLIVGLVLPFWKGIQHFVKTPKVVRVQPTDGSNRLVGIRVELDQIDELCHTIMRRASQESKVDDRKELLTRIAPNPIHEVIRTLTIHDCLNPVYIYLYMYITNSLSVYIHTGCVALC
jgi:hypothetical protein